MHAPANQPEFAAPANPAVDELNHIVEQAEALLQKLGDETSETAAAVRERVSRTLEQARARLATTATEAEEVAASLADQADDYVRRNPWQAVAIAAVLGGVLTFLLARPRQK